ncbi:MAG: arsenate reductase (glutaredoxin) [Candidatus Hydrogenedentes bacterium]|nr:arsenate reductase (glutaredoxin) [Candidatus Hydrogenedentota bacterium]
MAARVTIYHNPRCSKSREALALLREHHIEPLVIEYLKTAPDEGEIRSLLKKLGVSGHAAIRSSETAYRALGLSQDSDEDDVIAAMAANPILLQRPIVVVGRKAVIGRPPESILKLLQ